MSLAILPGYHLVVLDGGMNTPDLGTVSTSDFLWSGWLVTVTQVPPLPYPVLLVEVLFASAKTVLCHNCAKKS